MKPWIVITAIGSLHSPLDSVTKATEMCDFSGFTVHLTQWDQDKMAWILQTTFSWKKTDDI